VLRDACDATNEMWFKYIARKLPWVMLKAAVTLDGKMATRAGDARWVSGRESRMLVHVLRDEMDAVLIGVGTALATIPGSPPGSPAPGAVRSPAECRRAIRCGSWWTPPHACQRRRACSGSAPALARWSLARSALLPRG